MLPILPILIPLLTALMLLGWRRPSRARRWAAALSAVVQMAVAIWCVAETYHRGMQVLPLGEWPAPYGIILSLDLLAAIMLALSTITALASILYGFAELSTRTEHPLRLPLVQFLVVGINLSFLTGDLFNLFVAFEVMLIASYALLTLEADDWDIRQALPYITINLFGSALFLAACGLCYSLMGTLNFAEIAVRAPDIYAERPGMVTTFGVLLMLVFSIKAGVFPLYFWLPNSYPILPIALSALYSGMLTKVGVYVLLRIFGTVLPHELSGLHLLLAWLAGLTMVFGVIGAVSRNFSRGILSFHILSQIGFMVLAIGIFQSREGSALPMNYAIAAAIFYIIHHIIVKSSLFMIGGTAGFLNGSDDLKRSANLWAAVPILGVLFLFQALSLAGMPPLSGFWGKYMIIVAGIDKGLFALVALSIVASILTLFSMLKIWLGAFWKKDDTIPVRLEDGRWKWMTAIAGMMTALSICIGLGAQFFLNISFKAADMAMNQPAYSQKVLETPVERWIFFSKSEPSSDLESSKFKVQSSKLAEGELELPSHSLSSEF